MGYPNDAFESEEEHLLWRIRRRAECISDSQDGNHIYEMEQRQQADREKLVALRAAREGSRP